MTAHIIRHPHLPTVIGVLQKPPEAENRSVANLVEFLVLKYYLANNIMVEKGPQTKEA